MVICLTIAPTCSLQEYEMFQTQNEANLSHRFPIQVTVEPACKVRGLVQRKLTIRAGWPYISAATITAFNRVRSVCSLDVSAANMTSVPWTRRRDPRGGEMAQAGARRVIYKVKVMEKAIFNKKTWFSLKKLTLQASFWTLHAGKITNKMLIPVGTC